MSEPTPLPGGHTIVYTHAEVRAYGAAEYRRALEDAAKLAVEYPGRCESDYARGWNDATEGFAAAIRAMKDKTTAQLEAAAGTEARATLASERAANAILTAEVEALRKDAERYRWLRDKAYTAVAVQLVQHMPGEMDGAIDHAMQMDAQDAAMRGRLMSAIDAARGIKP